MLRIFSNPIRLIHEAYVYHSWAKKWRKDYPEYEQAFERNQRNVAILWWQFIILFYIGIVAVGLFVWFENNYELVKVIQTPVGIET